MTMPELTLALMVLLLTPGPTNTLMLLAGTERGPGRALALIPVELAAYMAVITPLALLSQGMEGQLATLRPVVAMAAQFTVASVHEVVELGQLDPESVVTPGIFVSKIVKVPRQATMAGGFKAAA